MQVMSQLLPCVGPLEALERFRAELLRGFLHPTEDVRRLVLKQVCADSVCGCKGLSVGFPLYSVCFVVIPLFF